MVIVSLLPNAALFQRFQAHVTYNGY